MKNVILFLFVLIAVSCNQDGDDEKIVLNISDIELIDKGQIPYSFEFHSSSESNGIENCLIKTINIKKNDTIKSIDSYVSGKILNISIISSPYDFDCNEDSCFTVHDVKFKLLGLKKGKYIVDISINNGYEKSLNHTITGIN